MRGLMLVMQEDLEKAQSARANVRGRLLELTAEMEGEAALTRAAHCQRCRAEMGREGVTCQFCQAEDEVYKICLRGIKLIGRLYLPTNIR